MKLKLPSRPLPVKRAAGAIARAAALTPSQRSSIASRAAAARWDAEKNVRTTKHMGSFHIGDLQIACAVLNDGRRVLNRDALRGAFGSNKKSPNSSPDPGYEFYPAFLAVPSVRPHVSDELHGKLSTPIWYRPEGSKIPVAAFDSDILALVCEAIMDAESAGSLNVAQQRVAASAKAIHRQLAKTGVVALVDEATGYQEVRDRNALQAILDAYLRTELAAWAKRFPDEFYEQIFRLRGWQWKGMQVNRPQCVGKYTKDLVYARLAPGVLAELERRARDFGEKKRKPKMFQWLTDDIGVPALSQHVHATIGFMRVAQDWKQFVDMMDRAFPKKHETLLLPMMVEAQAQALDEDELRLRVLVGLWGAA